MSIVQYVILLCSFGALVTVHGLFKGENVALGTVVSTNDFMGEGLGNVIDGLKYSNYSTDCFNAAKLNQTHIYVDLQKSYNVDSLRLYLPSTLCWNITVKGLVVSGQSPCYDMMEGYRVHVSNDPNNFTDLCYESKENISSIENIAFNATYNARYVRVQLPYSASTFSLCEIEIFTDVVNVALKRPTYSIADQLTTAKDTRKKANDGSTLQDFSQGHCYVSPITPDPWWEVDLGAPYNITFVRIYFPTGKCSISNDTVPCEKLNKGFQLYLSEQINSWSQPKALCFNSSTYIQYVDNGVHFNVPRLGRYLSVLLHTGSSPTFGLILCEVQVFTDTSSVIPAPIPNEGFTNVAYNKDTMSIDEVNPASHLSSNSFLITDGNVDQDASKRLCFLSRVKPDPWVEVDLARTYNISYVTLYLADSQCLHVDPQENSSMTCYKHMQGFDVFVSDQPNAWNQSDALCYNSTGANITSVETFNCSTPKVGRYVAVALPTHVAHLIVCELQVFVKTEQHNVTTPPPPVPTHIQGENVAVHKQVFVNDDDLRQAEAYIAANGVVDSQTLDVSGECYQSSKRRGPWWMVDFLKVYTVTDIRLYFPSSKCIYMHIAGKLREYFDSCYLMNTGFQVYISRSKDEWKTKSNLCYESQGSPQSVETINCIQGRAGRYAVIHIPSGDKLASLSLCEAQIFGKNDGCDFETDFCEWNNTGAENSWVRKKWMSPSPADGQMGYNVQMVSKSGGSKTELAELQSPELPPNIQYCLSFWYSIHSGIYSSGVITVSYKFKRVDADVTKLVFNIRSNKDVKWRKFTSKLKMIAQTMRVSLRGEIPKNKQVTLFMDEIILAPCGKDSSGQVTKPPTVRPVAGVNVALNKRTAALGLDKRSNQTDLAVDGKLNADNPRMCFSGLKRSYPWYMIDLGTLYTIVTIRLFLPDSMCKDLTVQGQPVSARVPCYLTNSDYEVYITNDTIHPNDVLCKRSEGNIQSVETFSCVRPIVGRHVVLRIPYARQSSQIIICEMQVFGDMITTTTPTTTTTVSTMTTPETTTSFPYMPCKAKHCKDLSKCQATPGSTGSCFCPPTAGKSPICYMTITKTGGSTGDTDVLPWAIPVGIVLAVIIVSLITGFCIKRRSHDIEYKEPVPDSFDQQKFENPIYSGINNSDTYG